MAGDSKKAASNEAAFTIINKLFLDNSLIVHGVGYF